MSTLIQDPPPGAPVPPILLPQDGYLSLDKGKFPASFAADVDADKAAFMADAQVPWGVEALSGTISELATRRSEFASILKSGGPDALVKTLRDRGEKLLAGG